MACCSTSGRRCACPRPRRAGRGRRCHSGTTRRSGRADGGWRKGKKLYRQAAGGAKEGNRSTAKPLSRKGKKEIHRILYSFFASLASFAAKLFLFLRGLASLAVTLFASQRSDRLEARAGASART